MRANVENVVLQANLRKFIIFNALSSFVLYYSIDKLLMAARGLSTSQIVLIEIVFAVTTLMLEVPSGVLSDRWSRKYVLALNMAFFIANTALWAVADGFSWFLCGTLAAAVHMALRSGTDTSFLYDTLSELGRADEFEAVYAKSAFWSNCIAIPAGVVGPIIADAYGLPAPLWATIPFSFAAVIVAMTFVEPKQHRTTGEASYWRHIRDAGALMIKLRELHAVMLLGILLGSALVVLDEYSQLYFVAAGVPLAMVGALGAIGNGVEAVAALVAERLARFARANVYVIGMLVSGLGYLAVWWAGGSLLGAAIVFIPWAVFYLLNPLITADIHRSLPSAQRATGESFVNFARNAAIVPVALLFSAISDSYSVAAGYGALGGLILMYLVVFSLLSRRNSNSGETS